MAVGPPASGQVATIVAIARRFVAHRFMACAPRHPACASRARRRWRAETSTPVVFRHHQHAHAALEADDVTGLATSIRLALMVQADVVTSTGFSETTLPALVSTTASLISTR